jgi:hypothetical protein
MLLIMASFRLCAEEFGFKRIKSTARSINGRK